MKNQISFPSAKQFLMALTADVLIWACDKTEREYVYLSPGIEEISLDGFARQDVTIDRRTRQITITMPTKTGSLYLKPALKLTSGATVTAGLNKAGLLNISDYNPCYPGNYGIDVTLPNTQITHYDVNFRSTGPLTLDTPGDSFEFKAGALPDQVFLPAKNLYGNGYVTRVFFKETGTARIIQFSGDGGCLSSHSGLTNALGIPIPPVFKPLLTPGTYTIEFMVSNFHSTNKSPQSRYIAPQKMVVSL